MKKIILLTLLVSLGSLFCFGQEKMISSEELPELSKTFINKHFPGMKIKYAEIDNELPTTYKVYFQNGVKIEFNKKGEWKEIECSKMKVPAALIPAAINRYVAEKYPGTSINKIEKEGSEIEVTLSNDVELKFNKDYKLIEIDN